MFEMPEAWPTWSASTAAVEADDAGPFATPSPIASAMSGSTKAAYVHDAWTNASAANPTAASANPTTTAVAAPMRAASGAMNGVITIMPAAAGSVATPACNGDRSSAAG